jgi:hypothetical protein
MMFNAAAMRTPAARTMPAAKPITRPADESGNTMVFGANSAPSQQPAAKSPPRAPAAAKPPAPPPAAPAPAAEPPPPEEYAAPQPEAPAEEPASAEAPEPAQATPGEQVEGDPVEEGAITGETEAPEAGAAHGGPSRAVVIGVAAAVGLLAVVAGVIVAVKKLGHRPPPQAAVEALAQAQAAADKDSIASLNEAETQANAALQAAPGSHFPEAWAELARIQVAFSDAFNDQAGLWTDRAGRALAKGDEKKKQEAEAKANDLQTQAKSRLRSAFEAAVAGNKMDPKSPEVALALADYYRAARSRSNLNRELKRATTLKADEARIALVQGEDLAAQDDQGFKALEKLKAALKGNPASAHIHFRMATVYLGLHQEPDAAKELQETLKISPQHERAKMAMEAIAPAGASNAAREGK